MKVLSLTEPFATLILNGKKCIETRSWKTTYRGELYIHASMTKISKQDKNNIELMNLIKGKELNYSDIICKCKLVDCIYMTEEYVNKMKKDNYEEYICGIYSKGRYAWVLEDITPLETFISAKGQLGLWDYYDESEIMDLMSPVQYGWLDKDNKTHDSVDNNFCDNYILQKPKEIEKNKIGVCWDQVELERYYFKGCNLNIKTFFIVYYDNAKCPTHTFLTFEKNNRFYWFEHAWEKFIGIHEYDTLNDLLLDIRNKFIKDELKNDYVKENLKLFEYQKPKSHITTEEFYKHCEQGDIINLIT